MAKPTKYPDWSVNTDGTDNDVVDPTSGQSNVVEPDAGKKLIGWSYTEKPPRQHFNWLSRLVTQWIRWIDYYITNTLSTALSSLSDRITAWENYNASFTRITGFTTADPATELQLGVTLPSGWDDTNIEVVAGKITMNSVANRYILPSFYIDSNSYAYMTINNPTHTVNIVFKYNDGLGSRLITWEVLIKKIAY